MLFSLASTSRETIYYIYRYIYIYIYKLGFENFCILVLCNRKVTCIVKAHKANRELKCRGRELWKGSLSARAHCVTVDTFFSIAFVLVEFVWIRDPFSRNALSEWSIDPSKRKVKKKKSKSRKTVRRTCAWEPHNPYGH